jgi:hypothetical protein
MPILRDIKVSRLVFAIGAMLLIADTLPHPNLSAGVIAHSVDWLQASRAATERPAATAIAESHP